MSETAKGEEANIEKKEIQIPGAADVMKEEQNNGPQAVNIQKKPEVEDTIAKESEDNADDSEELYEISDAEEEELKEAEEDYDEPDDEELGDAETESEDEVSDVSSDDAKKREQERARERELANEEERARIAYENEQLKQKKRFEKEQKKAEKKKAALIKKEERKKRHEERMKNPAYRRFRRFIIGLIVAAIVVVFALVAIFFIRRYVKFNNYNIVSNIDMTNVDEHTQVYKFHNGYIKCAGDGITYFDSGGMIWSESFSMAEPLCDVCGEYIAVVDMKSTEVYVFGTSGLINKISLSRNATNVEVSKFGTVAVVTNEGESNYIEIKNQDGSELVNIKTVFSSTGYLSDISLSEDGTELVAAYISVADGSFGSKVVFYDFSDRGSDADESVAAEFDQYKEMLVTSVEYMKGNKAVAVCDSGFTIYSAGGKPEIEYEDLALPWQIQSLFYSDKYIGFIVENSDDDNPYCIKVYNTLGKLVSDQSFAFAYNRVDFAGTNVVLYSDYDCDVYNFFGTHKFSYTFDNRIYALKPLNDGVNFIMLNAGQTQFIKLR